MTQEPTKVRLTRPPKKRKLVLLDPMWEDLSNLAALEMGDPNWVLTLHGLLRTLMLKAELMEKAQEEV